MTEKTMHLTNAYDQPQNGSSLDRFTEPPRAWRANVRSGFYFLAGEQEMNCPECGAPDNLCQTRFDEFLVLEFSDPGYGAVHNLTVATYMLQHSSKLSKEGWLYERDLMREFIVENKSPSLIRQQAKDSVDSGKRTFKFKSKDGKPVISKTAWSKTILDVRAENAEVYCEDVTAWARSALEEAEEIIV